LEDNIKKIGYITHFFDHINVAAIKLNQSLKIGDIVLIKGHTTNFKQEITSMQIDNENIEIAKPGDEIGLKVKEKVRKNDEVYKI
jgi:putative protease